MESEISATEFLSLTPDSRLSLVTISFSKLLPQYNSEDAADATPWLKALHKADFQFLEPEACLAKAALVSLRIELTRLNYLNVTTKLVVCYIKLY